MIINKISNYNNSYSYFGKSKKTETDKVSENYNNKANNRKKLALTLTFLAIAGAAAVAYKNPKVKDKLGLLKNKINKGFSGVKPNKMQKEAACTAGLATVIGAVAVREVQKNGEEEKTAVEQTVETTPVVEEGAAETEQPFETTPSVEEESEEAEQPFETTPSVEEESEETEQPFETTPSVEEESEETEQPVDTTPAVDEDAEETEQPVETTPSVEEKSAETEHPVETTPSVEEESEEAEQPVKITPAVEKKAKQETISSEVAANTRPAQADSKEENGQDYMFFDEFKKANGNFHKGKAYLGSELFTGSFAIQDGNKQTFFDYENGELKSAEIGVITAEGLFEPQKLKTYRTDKDGTKIIKTKTRKFTDRKDKTAPVQWHTDTIYRVTDSDVTVIQRDTFDQELTTYFKKQKNGTWKGFYEDRQFDYCRGHYIVPRDVKTDKILSPRQYKKFMES